MAARGTALITGASSGIGRELATIFAREGHDLVLVARSESKLRQAAEELSNRYGVRVKVLVYDLGDPMAPEAICHDLQQESIAVDVLVNNAGTQVYGGFAESDLHALLNLVAVNITSLTHLTRLLLPGMLARGRGRIVNVGSTGSFVPGPLNAVYCASKAYVLSLSQALSAELVGRPVTVTALCPGATDTPFVTRHGMQNLRIFKQMMSAARVAEIGYRAMMRGRRVVVTGWANALQTTLFSMFLSFTPTRLISVVGGYLMGEG